MVIGIGSAGFHGFQLCCIILYLGGGEGVPGKLVGCCLTKQHQSFLLYSHLTAYFFSEEFKWGYQDKVVVTSVGWPLVYGL